MTTYNISGFDDLEKTLNKLQKNVDSTMENYNNQQIPFEDLFTKIFMSQHSNCSDLDSWLSDSGFDVSTQEKFDTIDVDEFDEYVSSSTHFDTWQDMLDTAGAEFLQKQLGF